ncbi:MAG: hypothetical protein GQ569_08760 [Methylococcaceae bacterium]|nr:hypothetical protein [Methylococcaceae bacterium]
MSIAISFVIAETITINLFHLILIIIAALAAHASVNLLNEYHDFSSGLDFNTQRPPLLAVVLAHYPNMLLSSIKQVYRYYC